MLVALGVSGGIGAYKAVEVARGLQKRGHDVVAIMTHSATNFVGPLTFEAITRRKVITDQWESGANSDIEHISLASSIDLLLVAPATANLLGKFANGIADDFLTTLYTATKAPVLVAPAMNTQMFEHVAVRRNMAQLQADGVHFVDPGEGYLACGWIGKGRLAEPDAICDAAERVVRPAQDLTGVRLLVTAGPTYEDLDPVRYIGNRSSGRMGFALAEEATRRGARVTLVAGPSHVAVPSVHQVMRVRGAQDMHDAVLAHVDNADAVVMAAAVADYTPQVRAEQKVAKADGDLTIVLRRTPDILATLGARRAAGGGPAVLVGFAAETSDVVAKATDKLRRKQVDLIVANDVSRSDAGFDVDTNEVTLVSASGADVVPLQSKARIAGAVLDRLVTLLQQTRGTVPAS